MLRELILDTETTGFLPEEGDEVIELAMVEIIDGIITGKTYHYYFQPTKNIDISAQNVHSISIFDLKNKPKFDKSQINKIIADINGSNLVIHNAPFDMKFLNHHFKQYDLNFSEYIGEVIDTLAIARYKFPKLRNSLDALCDRFNISKSIREYHGAVVDCQLLAKVYIELKKEQLSLDLNINNETFLKEKQKIVFQSVS
jgi:DNA polymerase-3 subunit epsilon